MFFLTWLFLILMSLLNWSTLKGESRCIIFKKLQLGLSQSTPCPPMTPDTYSDVFTIAMQSETRSLACTWPWVQLRDCATLHAIHQAPPEPEHREHTMKPTERMKPTNVQHPSLLPVYICCHIEEILQGSLPSGGRGNLPSHSRQSNFLKTSWEHWC